MIIGKVIGTILGYLAGRLFGALLGFIAGHYFDKGLASLRATRTQENVPLAQHPFFATVFTAMGALAKADGRISEQEITGAERVMVELGLSGAARSEAIELFKQGTAADFELEPQISAFLQRSVFQPELKQVLLEYLVAFALADGELHAAEREILQRIAIYLGFNSAQFAHLLDMLQAQQRFHGQSGQSYGGQSQGGRYSGRATDELGDAYRALGVTASASDSEVKTAYRRLMSQHHPDKLMAQGVPENMIKLATEKAQEIQAAYEIIEKSRRA
jgi:DnaJ like chaperone protein